MLQGKNSEVWNAWLSVDAKVGWASTFFGAWWAVTDVHASISKVSLKAAVGSYRITNN